MEPSCREKVIGSLITGNPFYFYIDIYFYGDVDKRRLQFHVAASTVVRWSASDFAGERDVLNERAT